MIQWNEYTPSVSYPWQKKTKSHRDKTVILSEPLFLDTETSWNHDEENPIGWIYQWAFAFGSDTVTGRTPSQFIHVLGKILNAYGCNDGKKLVIYLHNLSYDIQYLKNYLFNYFKKPWKILAIAPHKFITFEIGSCIFKCTYMLANRSLAKWGKDLFIEYQKKEGLVDYEAIHYQDSMLTEEDDLYMEYDVLALQECFRKQLQIYGHDITCVPLTSTGYVRMECRRAAREDLSYWEKFKAMSLTLTQYNMLVAAFAGGLTHGNRYHASKRVDASIGHRDFASHFPTQQLCRDFPIGPWFNVPEPQVEDIKKWRDRGYCLLIEFAFVNARLKVRDYPLPYLQESKVRAGARTKLDILADNGRCLKVDGIVGLCATEVDWDIYQRLYEFDDIKILRLYRSASGRLPEWFRESVLEFFEGKTYYKEEAKKEKDIDRKNDLLISLMKSKNSLNGIYGLSATRLIRDELVMDEEGNWTIDTSKSDGEKLKEYYENKNSFMEYQWGVWTTAYARSQLYEAVDIVIQNSPLGQKAFIYSDTDSIFYVKSRETEEAFKTWNDELRERAKECGAFTKYSEKLVYMNQFDEEEEEITAFKFLHAKCYAFNTSDGELHCTIAGVAAKSKEDGTTREQELGSIDNLKDGKTFRKCGGARIMYNELKPTIINLEGHELEVSSSACITKTTKTLGELINLDMIRDECLEAELEKRGE